MWCTWVTISSVMLTPLGRVKFLLTLVFSCPECAEHVPLLLIWMSPNYTPWSVTKKSVTVCNKLWQRDCLKRPSGTWKAGTLLLLIWNLDQNPHLQTGNFISSKYDSAKWQVPFSESSNTIMPTIFSQKSEGLLDFQNPSVGESVDEASVWYCCLLFSFWF